jgi:hypothetical protein
MSNVSGNVYIILLAISLILSIFGAQYIANMSNATGLMWWVFAVIGYIVSGFVLGLISLGISVGVAAIFD